MFLKKIQIENTGPIDNLALYTKSITRHMLRRCALGVDAA
jgi:hypothetical protein